MMGKDVRNQAIAGMLCQYDLGNVAQQLHAVEYHAKTLSAAQCNWPIHNMTLCTIVNCYLKWRDWPVGVEVNVYTDYQGLQYCNTKQMQNSHQGLW